ncbi:MAG: hypothetical protein P8163_13480 [Candidatus Thiodiazotropha sp.]
MVILLYSESPQENQSMSNLQRFFRDWSASSAGDHGLFCAHWILALREYLDSDGEYCLSAKPYSTFQDDPSAVVPDETPQGAELANAIHGYDRVVGGPFAWYFNMLSGKSKNFTLAEAVLKDQMGPMTTCRREISKSCFSGRSGLMGSDLSST